MTDIETQRCVTLSGAMRAIAAAMEHAASIKVPVCVAVADGGGNLVSFARMDGAPLMSAGLAQNKAYSVMAFKGMATREWWDAIKDEPALLHGIVKTDRLTVFGGGVAITEGDGGGRNRSVRRERRRGSRNRRGRRRSSGRLERQR